MDVILVKGYDKGVGRKEKDEEEGKRMRKKERGVKVDGVMERGLENQKEDWRIRKMEGKEKEEEVKVDGIMERG